MGFDEPLNLLELVSPPDEKIELLRQIVRNAIQVLPTPASRNHRLHNAEPNHVDKRPSLC